MEQNNPTWKIEPVKGYFPLNLIAYKKSIVFTVAIMSFFFLVLWLVVATIKSLPYELAKAVPGTFGMGAIIAALAAIALPLRHRSYEKMMAKIVFTDEAKLSTLFSGYVTFTKFGDKRREISGIYNGIKFRVYYQYPKTQDDHTAGYQVDLQTNRRIRELSKFQETFSGNIIASQRHEDSISIRVLKKHALAHGQFEMDKLLELLIDWIA